MSTTDWIQLGVSIVSIGIAIAALLQTSKSTRVAAEAEIEASRGIIYITYDMLQYNVDNPYGYFVVKNYGHSIAKMLVFDFDERIVSQSSFVKNKEASHERLQRLKNLCLAPGQAIRIMFIPKNPEDDADFNFHIKYKSNGREYADDFLINVAAEIGMLKGKPINKQNPEVSIACLLGEIVERNLS